MGILGKIFGKDPLDELEELDEYVIAAPEVGDGAEESAPEDYEKPEVDLDTELGEVEEVREIFPVEDAEAASKSRSAAPRYGVTGRVGPAPRFTWGEVACNDGTPLPKAKRHNAVEAARTLNAMRIDIAHHYKVPVSNVYISINSWYRTRTYNLRIGGAAYSRHCEGDATDINVTIKLPKTGGLRLVPRSRVRYFAERQKLYRRGGVGAYTTFTHLDTRGYRARWVGP
jgi:hypothetical protein